MATSGSKEVTYSYSSNKILYARFNWAVSSVDVFNNTTTITYSVTLGGRQGGSCSAGAETYYFQLPGYIESAYDPDKKKNCSFDENSSITFLSGTHTIKHSADGTGSLTYIFEIYLNNAYIAINVDTGGVKMQVVDTVVLDKIDRSAHLLSVSDFNDEENPTITYTNPSKTRVEAYISLSGEALDSEFCLRNLTPTDTSYTFSLTDEERKILRQSVTSGNSRTVRLYLKNHVGGINYWDYRDVTLTLINHEPTLSPSVIDVNARTIELTGSNKKFIRYYSYARATSGAVARKEATIKSQYITNGSTTAQRDSFVFQGVESNTFYFGVTDNRGFTARDFEVIDFVPYVKLTCSLSLGLLTPNGTLDFTIGGKYFEGSFGAQSNSMEVEYSVRDKDGNFVFNNNGGEGSGWVPLGIVAPEVNEGNYTFTHTITGLDHTQTYTVTVNVIDALTPVQTVSSVVAALPIFDWNANDFHHHTNVAFSNGRSIIGTTSEGEEIVAFEPCNISGNLVIGAGGYNASEGSTLIYGNNIRLQAKDSIFINNKLLADYVTEQGSNGTWFYRKWNSGRVELYGYYNISNAPCNTALGGWYRTAVISGMSFPFSVNNPKTLINYESDGYGAMVWLTTQATMIKAPDYYLIRPTSSAGITGIVYIHVTGTLA